jgi:hypothetical protein
MRIRRAVLLAAFVLVPASLFLLGQTNQAPEQQPELPTFRAESRLVLVDVVPEYERKDLHTKALLTDLKREDFRVFDNGKEVPISTFDAGMTHSTRPIALWLIVQCPQAGQASDWHSDFMKDKMELLKPAFEHLGPNDVVGVAHWCDNGDAKIDLLPAHDADAALKAVETILHQKGLSSGDNRSGELAMQKMIRMTVENVHGATPDRLPVLLFFYGDHAGTDSIEADEIIKYVLETSGVVFGIGNGGWAYHPDMMFTNGQTGWLVHYYGHETGGQYYIAPNPKFYAAVFNYILVQMDLRYTLGFKPAVADGKKHIIKVELTKEAEKRYSGVQLHFREAYIPVAPQAQ